MNFLTLVTELGFPIAAAIAAGSFVFLTLKFILANVTSSVNSISGIIKNLDARVSVMNNDVQKIDIKVTHVIGIEPEFERISRAKHQDLRRD